MTGGQGVSRALEPRGSLHLGPITSSLPAGTMAVPDSGFRQGLYQWIYHTHEDAQEARASQEAASEDPSGEQAQEEDQPDSGNRRDMV